MTIVKRTPDITVGIRMRQVQKPSEFVGCVAPSAKVICTDNKALGKNWWTTTPDYDSPHIFATETLDPLNRIALNSRSTIGVSMGAGKASVQLSPFSPGKLYFHTYGLDGQLDWRFKVFERGTVLSESNGGGSSDPANSWWRGYEISNRAGVVEITIKPGSIYTGNDYFFAMYLTAMDCKPRANGWIKLGTVPNLDWYAENVIPELEAIGIYDFY